MEKLEMIGSGSLGEELGWKKSKVERFCRAARVQYDTAKDKGTTSYRVVGSDFWEKYKEWIEKGPRRQSVTKMEVARLKRNKKARERAAAKKKKTTRSQS